MARARNIKPGFFTNDLLAELSPLCRLLFIGLWTLADREGRLEDRPKRIKAELLPYDDCNADLMLSELDKAGFVLRYDVDGSRYIQIVNFEKHQNPHVKEQESTIPAPCKHSASTVQEQEIPERATLIPDSLLLIPDSPIHNPASGADAPKPRREKSKLDSDVGFDELWRAYPRKDGCSKANALKAYRARVAEGADPESIIAGVRRYAHYVAVGGVESRFMKHCETFLGPGKHYESDWTPQAPRASPQAQPLNIADQLRMRRNRGNPDDDRTIDI